MSPFFITTKEDNFWFATISQVLKGSLVFPTDLSVNSLWKNHKTFNRDEQRFKKNCLVSNESSVGIHDFNPKVIRRYYENQVIKSEIGFWVHPKTHIRNLNSDQRFDFYLNENIVDENGAVLLESKGEKTPIFQNRGIDSYFYGTPTIVTPTAALAPKSKTIQPFSGSIVVKNYQIRYIKIENLADWNGKILKNPLLKKYQIRVKLLSGVGPSISFVSKDGQESEIIYSCEILDPSTHQYRKSMSIGGGPDLTIGYADKFPKKITCRLRVRVLKEVKQYPFRFGKFSIRK